MKQNYMWYRNIKLSIIKRILLIIALGLPATITIIYGIVKYFQPTSGIDFHSYWISGIFLRQKIDPYSAYIENKPIPLPIYFIDQKNISFTDPHQPGLANVPANTAPIILLLFPFSFISWKLAKLSWTIINYLLMFTIPSISIKIFSKYNITNYQKIIIYLIFFAFYGTRNTLSSGQTIFIIYTCMLLTILLSEREEFLSSIFLGVALSKYSLSLPVVMLLFIDKKFRIIIKSIIIQFICLLVISIYTNTNPIMIFLSYIRIAMIHVNFEGVHFLSLFNSMSINLLSTFIITIIILIGIKNYLTISYRNFNVIHKMLLYSLFSSWSLLIMYHRAYDTIIILPFFITSILLIGYLENKHIYRHWILIISIVMILLYISLVLPASGITILPENINRFSVNQWTKLQQGFITIMLTELILLILFIFNKFNKHIPHLTY